MFDGEKQWSSLVTHNGNDVQAPALFLDWISLVLVESSATSFHGGQCPRCTGDIQSRNASGARTAVPLHTALHMLVISLD